MAGDKLPIYQLLIGNDSAGIDFVALVDEPAIEACFLAFSKAKEEQKHSFKVTNEDQRIVSGPLMIADLLIFRKDPQHGEHYVYFSAETIKNIVIKFFSDGRTDAVNLMHDSNFQPKGIFMFESFLIDKAKGINTPTGFNELPDGSWFGSYKINNDEIWNKFIKSGEFKGFSVEGFFEYGKNQTDEEKMVALLEGLLKENGYEIIND